MHVPNMIMVWHIDVALWRYKGGCVLTHGFWGWDMAWDRPNQHAYWPQSNFLTHVAHLLKHQDIQNIPQTSCLIDQFCWIWLLKMAHFSPFLTKLLWKVVLFWAKFSKTSWRCKVAVSLIIFLHGSSSELRIWEVSYKYNSPIDGAYSNPSPS